MKNKILFLAVGIFMTFFFINLISADLVTIYPVMNNSVEITPNQYIGNILFGIPQITLIPSPTGSANFFFLNKSIYCPIIESFIANNTLNGSLNYSQSELNGLTDNLVLKLNKTLYSSDVELLLYDYNEICTPSPLSIATIPQKIEENYLWIILVGASLFLMILLVYYQKKKNLLLVISRWWRKNF